MILKRAFLAISLAVPFLNTFADDAPVVGSDYPNAIAAIVNDRIVTADEVRSELLPLLPGLAREAKSQEAFENRLRELGRETLDGIVDRILIVQEFDREFGSKGAKVPESAIENQIQSYIAEYFNGDRSNLVAFLKQQGKSMRSFRLEQKEQAIVQIMKHQMVQSSTEVSPEKIANYYLENEEDFYQPDAIELRQIMLTGNSEKIGQKAEKIEAQLAAGADFATLAKKYSQDDMAINGGNWGWVERMDISPVIASAAFELEPGQWSQPIALGDYLFIVYVQDKRPEGVATLEEVRDQIAAQLSAQYRQREVKNWIERLRERAYIKYFI